MTAVFVWVLVLGCRMEVDADEEAAYALWDAFQGYESWGQTKGWTTTPIESLSHVGAPWVVAYYDEALLGWDGIGQAPAGAISMKAQWEDETALGPPDLFTAMQKQPGYDADHDDWFWAWYDGEGNIEGAGKVRLCYQCHEAADHDYLYLSP